MGDEELAKDLGLVSAMTIGIGTMIGAGIFVLPGVAAQEAGPIVVVSFVVGGVIAMVNALSISELGTAMPKAGGGYYYVNRALGPMFGSIAGLGDWMGLAFASAFYSIGFGQYLSTLAPIPGVLFLNDIQIGALIAGGIFVAINYIGAKETGSIQTVIVFTLLAILGVFAIAGWLSFDYARLISEGGLAPEGYGAILPATALVFVSFLGYAKIATVAEEMKNPGRNLPIAIIGSVGIVTVIYAILVTVMLGVVPWPELSLDAPVADAARVAFPGGLAGIAATIMTLGALLATASSANASILSSARINFAMGRDKIVTDWLNEIHPNYATPYRSIALTGGMILVLIAFLGRDLEILAKAASVLHLMVYALMNVALIVFRETDPEGYDPDFRVPLYPITPIVGTILSLALIGFMNPNEIALSALFVVVAVSWYFLYARGETDHQGYLGQYVLDRADEMPDAAVSAASTVQPDNSDYRVMVPLSNPRTEKDLIELGSLIAKAKGGTVVATHIVQVPDQTPLYGGSEHVDRIDAESKKLLEAAREDANTFDADVETKTVVSHRSFEEVFDAARSDEADLVVMGWNPNSPLAAGRVESPLDELTGDLPCDFLVLKDRSFDLSDVLVPTAGGYSSDLSAEVAEVLLEEGSDVSLLYVVDDESEQSEGETFLSEWAAERGLDDAERIVDTTGDVEDAIARHAEDRSMVIIGATREGLLSRLVRGSLAFEVLNDVDSSVLLAERPQKRSLKERLFGR
ncbi:amino acid permease [Halohasta litorea]|uniref:Amino acid permease n=1 Tax=Halohasta litorea TaxID=869891 RepID=A0ABD6D6L6_9EURY|nr:amino acid permease [Halohasta litorea]